MDFIRKFPESEDVGQLDHGGVSVKLFRDARVEIFFDQICRRDKVLGRIGAHLLDEES